MTIKKITADDTLDIRHRVLWPDKPVSFCKLDDDPNGIHYGLFIDEKLVSVASIFITENSARLRKFATLKEFQGRGYGSKLLNHILNDITVERFWCDARLTASRFYTRFGMNQMGDVFYKSHVEYIVMEKLFKD